MADSLVLTLPDKKSEHYTRTAGASTAISGSPEKTNPQIASQVSEGLNLSGGAKAAVTEYFRDKGRFPTTNSEAGLVNAHQINGRYVSSVAVTTGVITVTYDGDESDASNQRQNTACNSRRRPRARQVELQQSNDRHSIFAGSLSRSRREVRRGQQRTTVS